MTLLELDACEGNPPFVWLHGFTQTAQSGYEFRRSLGTTHPVCALDLPGHGSRADYSSTLANFADEIALSIGDRQIDLGGYSLGGRLALHVAAQHPSLLRRLVVVSATAGLVNSSERQQRREDDERLARKCENGPIDEFLRDWLAQPLFASLPHDETELAARSRDTHGLARSLRTMGTGNQEPLDEALRQCRVPTLIVVGERDEKFLREAHRLLAALPTAELAVVADAGHAVHLEQPERTASLIRRFLSEGDEHDENRADTPLQ